MDNNKSIDKLQLKNPISGTLRPNRVITFDNHFLSFCWDVEKYEDMINHILKSILNKNRTAAPRVNRIPRMGNYYYCLFCKKVFLNEDHMESNQGIRIHQPMYERLEREMDMKPFRRTAIKDIEKLFLLVYVEDSKYIEDDFKGYYNQMAIDRRSKQPKAKISRRPKQSKAKISRRSKQPKGKISKGSTASNNIDRNNINELNDGAEDSLVIGNNTNNTDISITNQIYDASNYDDDNDNDTRFENPLLLNFESGYSNFEDLSVFNNGTNNTNNTNTITNQIYETSKGGFDDTLVFKFGNGCNSFDNTSDYNNNNDNTYGLVVDNGTNNNNTNSIGYVYVASRDEFKGTSVSTYDIDPNCVPLVDIKSEGDNNNLADFEVKCEPNNSDEIVEHIVEATDFSLLASETPSPPLYIKKASPSETKQGKGIKRKDCDGGDDNQN